MREGTRGGRGGLLVRADGRWDVSAVLLIQRGVNNRAVLQGHL